MLHNEITSSIKILSTGFSEGSVMLEDGEEMLPSGYYMEIEVDNEDFVVPVDQRTYQAIHNAINSVADITSEMDVVVDEAM